MTQKYLLTGLLGQYFDDNGDALNGGQIETYVAGTTTPAATYKDDQGVATHANPIVLDAAGRVPSGVIFGDLTAAGYKLVLKTSGGTTIDTVDNVRVIVPPSLSTVSEWVAGPTPTFVATNQFSAIGDYRTEFHANRRVRFVDASTLYGTVQSASYAAGPNRTTVTVLLDSGVLSVSLVSVAYGFVSYDNPSYPTNTRADAIAEFTSGNGVTIDGVKLKDNDVQADAVTDAAGTGAPDFPQDLNTDQINELTPAAGVTVDGCLIKDGQVADADTVDGEHASAIVTTARTLSAIAGGTAGDVGMPAMLRYQVGATVTFGSTAPGSDLEPSNGAGSIASSPRSGTWRCVGYSKSGATDADRTTEWIRIL